MKTVLVSKFKTHCVALLDEVWRTGEPLVVARRGQPIARVEPLASHRCRRQLGALRGRMRWKGDLAQIDWSGEWEDDP